MKYEKFICLFFIISSCLFSGIRSHGRGNHSSTPTTGKGSHSSIPTTQDGFWYDLKKGDQSRAFIEAFFDPLCPDSRDSWPALKKALKHYSPHQVSLAVHTFPLPYHDNAFATSRALHIVNEVNSSFTFPLLEALFKNQAQFSHNVTSKLSKDTVNDRLVNLTTKVISSFHSAIESGFFNPATDHATRVDFKLACVRGVYETPFFFVNGFPLSGNAPNYNGWKKVLDPLVVNVDKGRSLDNKDKGRSLDNKKMD